MLATSSQILINDIINSFTESYLTKRLVEPISISDAVIKQTSTGAAICFVGMKR